MSAIEITRGECLRVQGTWTDEAGTPIDLTGRALSISEAYPAALTGGTVTATDAAAASGQGGSLLWTPSNLASPPSLWFDQFSSTSLDGSDGIVQLGDRSANGWDAAQATPARRPVLLSSPWRLSYPSGGYLDFDPSANALYQDVPSAWMFAVFQRPLDLGNSERVIGGFSNSSTATRIYLSAGGAQGGTGNHVQFGGRRLDSDGFDYAVASAPHDADWTLAIGRTDYVAREIDVWVNGDLAGSKSNAFGGSGNTANTASTRGRMGGNMLATPTTSFSGQMRVFLAGVGLPSNPDVDRIFGWAAWQCGLQDRLPIGHPYRNAPP